jgi:two-component system cell cycle sensor histidine kinase/response regulator CckA
MSKTVLVVDDEPMSLDVMRKTLARAGFHVLSAQGGKEALAECGRHCDAIHAAVIDIMMPGMIGPQLAQILDAMYPGIHVQLVSGYPADALSEFAVLYEFGNITENGTVLMKPFLPSKLVARVKEMLGE